ncbi:MAG: molybdopterin molybdotransferase MoeA [Armatimonadota bacterium]|jgi:molybdopterin molybdotransferase
MIDPKEARRTILEHTPARSGDPAWPDFFGDLAPTAEPVCADRDIPAADLSRMDGYAIIAPLEAGAELRRVGEIPAGSLPEHPVAPGECFRIFTGGVLPPGANAVVKQEEVGASDDGELIRLNCSVEPGEYVTARGAVASQDDVVLPAGSPPGAAQAAVCAAVGEMPRRRRPPLLALLCTGEEIVPRDVKPGPHQTRDVNGPALTAAARSIGSALAAPRVVPDDAGRLTDELRCMLANDDYDGVVTVGAVSVGDYDLVPDALRAVGAEIILHGVRCRPGKPFLFALGPSSKPVFGIPGNVMSALVTFFEFVAPALRKMAGMPEPWAPTLPVRLAADVAGIADRTRYALARVTQDDDGHWVAEPLPMQHSADVAAAGPADGAIIVPPGDGLAAGGDAHFRPWRPLW